MEDIEVLIDGVPYPWSRVKFARSFGVSGQILNIEVPGREVFDHMDPLEVKIGGTTLTKGNLYKYGWKEGKTIITGFNYKRKLQQLPGIVTAGGTEASTHLENQLVNTSITEGTFNTYGAVSLDYGATTQALFMRRTPIEDLLFATGWEWNVLPSGVSNFKTQCGTDRSDPGAGQVKFSKQEGTLLYWEEDYVVNGLEKVARVRVLGRGMGDAQAGGLASTGGYSVGDPEITINRSSLPTDAMCASAAAAILADLQNSVKYGVPRVVYEPTTAFDVFDTINIVDESLQIDEDLRVAGIDMDIKPTGMTTLLSVCNLAHLQTTGERFISSLRSRVEDNYARTKSIQDLDDIDDGANFARVDVLRGRPVYFGVPRFYRFNGEHELGYTITETLGGTVEVLKDKLTVTTGTSSTSEGLIQAAEKRADFTKEPTVKIRFKIGDVASHRYRQHYFGLYGNTGHRAYCVINSVPDPYDDSLLKSYTADSVSTETQTMESPLASDVFHTVDIYVKSGKVEYYLNGTLATTHTTRVPTTGEAATLFVWSFAGWGIAEAFPIEVSQYEVNQKW